jgi:hypothetical protein
MRKQKWMIFAAIGACVPFFAMADDMQSAAPAAPQANCSTLSTQQQAFANKLSAENKMMFCNQFTESHRITAMQMASSQDASGNMMSADQAVQKVAMQNNMMMGNQAAPKSQGGCPVK